MTRDLETILTLSLIAVHEFTISKDAMNRKIPRKK